MRRTGDRIPDDKQHREPGIEVPELSGFAQRCLQGIEKKYPK
jgi:hypothetical protein